MRILIIGGTRFVGLAIARECLKRGHELTLFHRSDSVPRGTEAATHVRGDRESDLDLISDQDWDVVIDVCAYRPHQVSELTSALNPETVKYVLISTVSVYSEEIPANGKETALLASLQILENQDLKTIDITGETYGPLKVKCEQVAKDLFANLLVIRPTYVIGPDDYTNRFTVWVERVLQQDVVELPTPSEVPLQYIDVRDLAQFTMDQIEHEICDTFHVATPSGGDSFARAISEIATATGRQNVEFVWLSESESLNRASEFPLWAQSDEASMLQMDTTKALKAGLEVRPLSQTIIDITNE